MPGAQCTRSLACEDEEAHEQVHHRFTGFAPAFPARWFYGFLRDLPGDRAFLPPSPARSSLASLTSASRCQDHTTSPSAMRTLVSRTHRVHRIPRPRPWRSRNAPR